VSLSTPPPQWIEVALRRHCLDGLYTVCTYVPRSTASPSARPGLRIPFTERRDSVGVALARRQCPSLIHWARRAGFADVPHDFDNSSKREKEEEKEEEKGKIMKKNRHHLM
jgi:hypothetical protein